MSTIIGGSSPSITFSDSTTQASAGLTSASPVITSGVLTFPNASTQSAAGLVVGSASAITSGTAVSASGTSITYSSIPSWVKRITVIFNGVKTNGTSYRQVQLGSGSTTTSGYTTSTAVWTTNASNLSPTTGFYLGSASGGSDTFYGHMVLTLLFPAANTWTASYWTTFASGQQWVGTGMTGAVSLSGTLDRVVLTTVNGTDQYNAGQVNIFYE